MVAAVGTLKYFAAFVVVAVAVGVDDDLVELLVGPLQEEPDWVHKSFDHFLECSYWVDVAC